MMTKTRRARPLLFAFIGIGVILGGVGLYYRLLTKNSGPEGGINRFSRGPSNPAAAVEKAVEPPPKPPTGKTADELAQQIKKAFASKEVTDWEWILTTLFPALAAMDRPAAARLVASLPPGDAREQLLRRLSRIWAAADFADAVTWIAAWPDPVERKAAFEDACFEVADKDPVEAINAWEGLEFTADDHVLENLVQNWAIKDLAAAQAWLSTKPSSKFRDQAVARVGYVMANSKPAEAATFVTAEIPVGPAQTEAALSVLNQWAQSDLAGATAWAQRLPPGDLAERARTELAGLHSK